MQTSTLAFNKGCETQKTFNFGGKLSFIPSFLLPERLRCCYIYLHCSSLYRYLITLEPCALNAQFQDFIPRFNTIFLICGNLKEGSAGEWRPKSRVTKARSLHLGEASKYGLF
jgi:hypothetical protein